MRRRTLAIRTPENVVFDFELAGITARAMAWLIDMAIMAILFALLVLAIGALAGLLGGLAMALIFIGAFLVQWWFQALSEFFWIGQTPGKRALGLRVLSSDGLRPDFSQAVIRNLVRIVDILPALYLMGAVSIVLDARARRLGDLAASTIVIRERRAALPSEVVPPALRYNTFVKDPAVVHSARAITPPEREAMVALCLRRDSLPLPVRRRLFARMAAHLSDRLGVHKPSFFTDENFVLNLTAIVLGGSDPVEPVRRSSVPPTLSA